MRRYIKTRVNAVSKLSIDGDRGVRYLISTSEGIFHTSCDAQFTKMVNMDVLPGKQVELTTKGIERLVVDVAVLSGNE